MYFLGENPLNLFSLMTLSHILRVGATVLSATPELGKEGRTKTRLCLLFPLRRALKNMLHQTKLPGTPGPSAPEANLAVHLIPTPMSSLGFTQGVVRRLMEHSFSHLSVLKTKQQPQRDQQE